ncbi:hypothetical protein [Donghicola sp. XS_ASV15]|uniref:hypothetical protein n=1 Tax=Donghicola sp. XS_ASV15 TaxID=3241295 RepID=UPI003516F613
MVAENTAIKRAITASALALFMASCSTQTSESCISKSDEGTVSDAQRAVQTYVAEYEGDQVATAVGEKYELADAVTCGNIVKLTYAPSQSSGVSVTGGNRIYWVSAEGSVIKSEMFD